MIQDTLLNEARKQGFAVLVLSSVLIVVTSFAYLLFTKLDTLTERTVRAYEQNTTALKLLSDAIEKKETESMTLLRSISRNQEELMLRLESRRHVQH